MRNSSTNPENQKLKICMTKSAITLTPPTVGRPSADLLADKMADLCCDYIQKYSRLIGFLYFYRPINIIFSADWSDYIKDITRRLTKPVPKLYNWPIVGQRLAGTPADDRPMICGPFKYDISRLIGRPSADHRPIAKTRKLSANGKKIITR